MIRRSNSWLVGVGIIFFKKVSKIFNIFMIGNYIVNILYDCIFLVN